MLLLPDSTNSNLQFRRWTRWIVYWKRAACFSWGPSRARTPCFSTPTDSTDCWDGRWWSRDGSFWAFLQNRTTRWAISTTTVTCSNWTTMFMLLLCWGNFSYSQLLLYRTLGYTGIRAHTGPRISVPRRNSSQYVLYIAWYSDIPDSYLYTGL